MARRPRYTRDEAAAAVAASRSYAEALRRLGMRPAGGNWLTLKKYAIAWGLSVTHFDPYAARTAANGRGQVPLAAILVEGSTYSRGHLKRRLYEEGLKERRCELCGQDEEWRGRRMALILDHINGIGDDHRLENLQIVCPNCAATLETHCGRNARQHRICVQCTAPFFPSSGAAPLLEGVLIAVTAPTGGERRAAAGRAPVRGTAACGDRRARLPGGRAPLRRVRQRDPQVAARL